MLNVTFPLLPFSNTFSDLKSVCKGSPGLRTQLTSQLQTRLSQERLRRAAVQQRNTERGLCVRVWPHTSKPPIYTDFGRFKRFYPTGCSYGLYSCRARTSATPPPPPLSNSRSRLSHQGWGKPIQRKLPLTSLPQTAVQMFITQGSY